MLKKYSLFFILCFICSVSVKADFKGLPAVTNFGEVNAYSDAVKMLFNDRVQEMQEIKTLGDQVVKVFVVKHLNKKWFVKITREDCLSCDTTHFDTEWKLKHEYGKKYSWVSSKNAELVFPDKGAIFVLGNKKNLIASYAWAPGKTLYGIHSEYFNRKERTGKLSRAYYRYGQVLAVTHLDPEKPSQEIDDLLNRPVRLHLSDRNGENEQYHEGNDRIYILDLADDSEYVGRKVLVVEELAFWLSSMLDNYEDLESASNCGRKNECLLLPFDSFAQGYISSLPLYDSDLLMLMLKRIYLELVEYNCQEGPAEFCVLEDRLKTINWVNS